MRESELRQLLCGHELPGDDPARCASCFCKLRDGAFVGGVARRPYAQAMWGVRVYCPDHTPGDLPTVPHGESALFDAELGSLVDTMRQTHSVCLLSVELCDVALDEVTEALPEP